MIFVGGAAATRETLLPVHEFFKFVAPRLLAHSKARRIRAKFVCKDSLESFAVFLALKHEVSLNTMNKEEKKILFLLYNAATLEDLDIRFIVL